MAQCLSFVRCFDAVAIQLPIESVLKDQFTLLLEPCGIVRMQCPCQGEEVNEEDASVNIFAVHALTGDHGLVLGIAARNCSATYFAITAEPVGIK